MEFTPTTRQRLIIATAAEIYSKLAKSVVNALENLNLPTMHVETASGRVQAGATKVQSTKTDEVCGLANLHVEALRDALALMYGKTEKAKKQQTELQIDTKETDHTQEEIRALARILAEDPELELGTDASLELVGAGADND